MRACHMQVCTPISTLQHKEKDERTRALSEPEGRPPRGGAKEWYRQVAAALFPSALRTTDADLSPR
jgi:hypothetical protein